MAPRESTWWRSAVIYQVYIRSFGDGNGDGLGDIAGIRSRLPYLAGLGVDAVWVNPWYPSPMADAGYDVSDHRAVEPLVRPARVVPGSAAGGPGLSRTRAIRVPPRGRPGRGPAPERLDERVRHARVAAGDRAGRVPGGVVPPPVHARAVPACRTWGGREFPPPTVEADGVLRRGAWQAHPHWDRDEVHDIYRDWRRLADSYADPKVFVAEAWVDEPERLVRYVREDELHTAFNVTYLQCPWGAEALRAAIDETLAEHESVGAPPTWVLSNHDVVRHVSRYARPQDCTSIAVQDLLGVPADLELGRRRSRAAVLLTLALPGGAYVYQGEELGLEEIEDLPEQCLQDPTWERSGHTDRGRDGCRVPVPWSGDGPPYAFSPPDATSRPWLPQPEHWAELTAERQTGDPASMLELYRSALGRRRQLDQLGDGSMEWLDTPDGSLRFARGSRFVFLANLDAEPFAMPDGELLLCSGHLDNGLLGRDTAVWLRR